MGEEVPYCNPARHRHIKRMFRASLRDLKTHVTLVDDFLVHSVDFMPKHQRVTPT